MPVKINGATSGSVTLAAPDSGSDVTLTLPSSTMDLGAELDSKLDIAGGKILQVVGATYGIQVDSSSNTYADTGLTASITPSSASNKVLIFVVQAGVRKDGSTYMALRLMRGATQLGQFGQQDAFTNSSATNVVGASSYAYLDSPATTSSVTYKTQFASVSNVSSVSVQSGGSLSSIILMEVSA